MSNPQWTKWWARKFSASRYEVIAQIFNGEFAESEFGATMPHMLVTPERGNHAVYLDKAEWEHFSRALYSTVARSRDTFAGYKKKIKRDQQHFVGVCEDIGSQELKEASEGQLLEWFENYIDAYKKYFQTSIMIPFIIEPMISDDARKELEGVLKERGLEAKRQHYFDAIFLPEEKNAITQEREDLLRIAEDVELHSLLDKDLNYRLDEHTEKYQWIPCSDINDEPWTIETFRKLYEELCATNWQEELEEMVHFGNRAEHFQTALDELVTTVEQRTLFTIAHETVFLKDERDDYRRRGSFFIQPFFAELGRRMGDLSLNEVSNLLQREVQVFLGTGRLPLAGKIKERTQGFVMLKGPDTDEVHIFSGEEANAVRVEQIGDA